MEFGLKGKIAIVTGGSSGIGKTIASCFASEGAKVAICARELRRLEGTAKEIEGLNGIKPLSISVDVRSYSAQVN